MFVFQLSFTFTAREALVVIIVAVELKNGDRDRLSAHVTVNHVWLDLGRWLLLCNGWFLCRLFGQLDFTICQVDFNAFGAMVVLLVVFETLLVDFEELLTHETLVVGYLYIACLAIEQALFFRQETFACDWLLACHASHVWDSLEVTQNGEIQFAWTSSVLFK